MLFKYDNYWISYYFVLSSESLFFQDVDRSIEFFGLRAVSLKLLGLSMVWSLVGPVVFDTNYPLGFKSH